MEADEVTDALEPNVLLYYLIGVLVQKHAALETVMRSVANRSIHDPGSTAQMSFQELHELAVRTASTSLDVEGSAGVDEALASARMAVWEALPYLHHQWFVDPMGTPTWTRHITDDIESEMGGDRVSDPQRLIGHITQLERAYFQIHAVLQLTGPATAESRAVYIEIARGDFVLTKDGSAQPRSWMNQNDDPES